MTRVGNYRVLRKIGEGGFGRVFLAEHLLLEEPACLKQNKHASRGDVDLLKYEAKLLWKLSEYHSIPSVKDFIQIDLETAVVVLSHIEGKTIEDIVSANGGLHPEDASWITERLLGALYYAHSYGVIHTDVKPENVFVEPKKRDIKLIDFGLASFKPRGATRPLGYTPRYAAPELVLGKPPIPETDLYGTGIVLLRALGGNVAKKNYRADTPEELIDFCNSLLRYDAVERPNWERDNPLEKLSDLRLKIFGRRHIIDDRKLKGGGI